jgi:hypothetical protein
MCDDCRNMLTTKDTRQIMDIFEGVSCSEYVCTTVLSPRWMGGLGEHVLDIQV